MSHNRNGGRWVIARILLTDHLLFLAVVWLAVATLATAIAAAVAVFGTVSSSVWDDVALILRWFMIGYGFYLISRWLPVCIVHGRTRREFMVQATLAMVVATAALAILTALGYALESDVYRGMGWPHELSGERLFTSSGQFGTIFTTYWVLLGVWTIAGALLAAGFYRSDEWGLVTIPPALALVVVAGIAVGFHGVPFVNRTFDIPDVPMLVTLASGVAGFVAGAAMTWGLVRDIPVRAKAA